MPILLKACPRCGGDIELPRDKNDDPNCIQCGFEANPHSVARMKNRIKKISKEPNGSN